MHKTTINTFNELDQWLSNNYNFEDGYVLSINENPLTITIGYDIKGSYKANSERHILAFLLTPSTVIEWTYDSNLFKPSYDHCIVSIEPIESQNGISLEFSTPYVFKLTINSLTIQEMEVIETTVKPWINEKEVYVTSNLEQIPEPSYWKEKLEEYGHHIAFRYYGGEEREPEAVPYPDY